MHPRSFMRNSVGLLALAAALALASPGVNVVRAEPALPAADSAAAQAAPAQCSTPGTTAAAVASDGETDTRVGQAPLELQLPSLPDDDFVVLNTRGYNYGPSRKVAPNPAPAEGLRR